MTDPMYYSKEAFDELVEVIAKTDNLNRKLKKAGLKLAGFKIETQSRGEWPSSFHSTFDPKIDDDLSPSYYTGKLTRRLSERGWK